MTGARGWKRMIRGLRQLRVECQWEVGESSESSPLSLGGDLPQGICTRRATERMGIGRRVYVCRYILPNTSGRHILWPWKLGNITLKRLMMSMPKIHRHVSGRHSDTFQSLQPRQGGGFGCYFKRRIVLEGWLVMWLWHQRRKW